LGEKRELNLLLDDGGPIVVWQEDVPKGLRRRLLITTRICDNPECNCRDVWLSGSLIDDRYTDLRYRGEKLLYKFRPREGEPSELAPPRLLAAGLDIETGKVSFNPNAPAELHDPEMLARLREGLDQHHLEKIRKRWRNAKGVGRDQWRKKDWSWWEPGRMVSWLEVFPDDSNIIFPQGEEVYWADDMYCITPGCTCKEVGLNFSRVTSGKIENLGAVSVTLPSCRYSGLISDDAKEGLLRSLWDELQKDPEIRALLKERKKRIMPVGREIALLSARRKPDFNGSARETIGAGSPKVGRNDPCPCGSGKKYKKCCLR